MQSAVLGWLVGLPFPSSGSARLLVSMESTQPAVLGWLVVLPSPSSGLVRQVVEWNQQIAPAHAPLLSVRQSVMVAR